MRASVIAISALLGSLAVPLRADPGVESLLSRGHALFYRGDHVKALESYDRAVRLDTETVEGWLNGAVLLQELGQERSALQWYARAAALSAEPDILNALGWAQYRSGDLAAAAASFQRALRREPNHAYALLGAARAELDSSRPEEALKFLDRASAAAPLLTLVPYYRGKAFELQGETSKAEEAYRQTVTADSYFIEGRDALGRIYLRRRRYPEAWRQFAKALDAEPKSRRFRSLLSQVQPFLRPHREAAARAQPALGLLDQRWAQRPSGERGLGPDLVPTVRIGLGTDIRGKPRPRQFLAFKARGDFDIMEALTRRKLLRGRSGETWQARVKRVKKRVLLAVIDPSGKTVLQHRGPLLIRPQSRTEESIALDPPSGKILRGELEIALFRANLRVVNTLDLESYTHGVLSAEMPIQSPVEALKAQAVVARSHALYIKRVTRRHHREGYDLCDDQHCQVYAGARAESPRSREVVDATRGRVVTYRGKVAHVIYSSNCGGYTQSGRDVTGWGDIPYWSGVADGNDPPPRPASPWKLRAWLTSSPQAYCKPSTFVHASHFRWSRVIPFRQLEEKIDRRLNTGRLQALRPLRRASTGNVNALLVRGSRRSVTLDSETQIRALIGVGSLRSTLFFIETDYGPDQKPEALVFHGGGWGHGVGLCQSGAMGRAESGQDYEQIIKAYFRGTEIGTTY